MSTAIIPLWQRDRACVQPTGHWVLAFPMPGSPVWQAPANMTPYPLQMNVNDAVELWWRVSEFLVEVTDVDGWGNYDITCVRKRGGINITHEKELTYPESYLWEGSVSDVDGIDTLNINAKIRILPPENFVYNEDGDQIGFSYYIDGGVKPDIARCTPAMLIEVEIIQDAGAEVTNYVRNFDDSFKPIDREFGTTFDGRAITLGIANMGTPLDGPAFDVVTTIKTWYSWDGWWNTTNGERL